MREASDPPVPVEPVLQVRKGELVAGLVLAVAWASSLNRVVREVDKLNPSQHSGRRNENTSQTYNGGHTMARK